jgi:integrase/recombinase XerD
MSTVTVTTILHTTRMKKANKYPVKLKITHETIRYYYSIGISCTKEEWLILNSDTPGIFKNDRLKMLKQLDKAERIIADLEPIGFTFQLFKDKFTSKPKAVVSTIKAVSIESAFKAYITELNNNDKIGTRNLYKTTMNSLIRYNGNVLLSEITPKYLKDYENWMLNKEKISKSFTGMCTRNLRTIFNRELQAKHITNYPFSNYKCMNGTGNKRSLSVDTLKLIINHKPLTVNQQHAKDFWLLSFLCNGMNMKDILNLKNNQLKDNQITFTRVKTEHSNAQPITVELSPIHMGIINRNRNSDTNPNSYLFPVLSVGQPAVTQFELAKTFIKNTNHYFNQMLKELDITERITTYAARHSFASLSLQAGVSIYDIGQGMGHASITTTQRYIAGLDVNKRKENSSKLLTFIQL